MRFNLLAAAVGRASCHHMRLVSVVSAVLGSACSASPSKPLWPISHAGHAAGVDLRRGPRGERC